MFGFANMSKRLIFEPIDRHFSSLDGSDHVVEQ